MGTVTGAINRARPVVSWKPYKCVVCGTVRYISTNHTGDCYDYCSGCSCKGIGFDHDNTMVYGGRAYRRMMHEEGSSV